MRRRGEVAALTIVIALIALAFSDVLLLGKAFYQRDLPLGFYPAFAALRHVVRAGQIPFWNSYFSNGQPLAANPVYAAFYPLPWLAIPFDGFHAITLVSLLHYAIAASGMFFLLRWLRLHPAAAAFGAISFALGGVMVSLHNLLTVLYAVSWMPWLGLFSCRFFQRRRVADFALAALVLGLILLAGEQSIILQSGALVGAYAIYRWRNPMAIIISAALCLSALLVGLVQIAPALDHQRDSHRATPLSYGDATTWSLHPARPLEMLDANLFGHFAPEVIYYWISDHQSKLPWLFSIYPGLLATALIGAGLVRRIRGWAFVSVVSLISYLVAIGRHGPLFRLLYSLGLRSVRYPEKFFISAIFLLTVFAAIAADEFLRDAAFRRVTFIVAGVLALIAAGVLTLASSPAFARVWGLHADVEVLTSEAHAGAITSLLIALALVLILALHARITLCFALLALFVAVDLGSRVRAVAPRFDGSFYAPPPLARALAAQPQPVRIYNDAAWQLLRNAPILSPIHRVQRMRNALVPETQVLWGIESALELDVAGTDLAPSVEFATIFAKAQAAGRQDLLRRLVALAGVTHVVVLRDGWSADDPARVLPIPGRRYYFAQQLLSTNRILDPGASLRAAFVERPFVPGSGRILRASEQGNDVDLDVESAGDAALIISITRHKYWQAAIDGHPASIYPANVAFQGLTIPRGHHHVSFRYSNPLIIFCGVVSILAAATLVTIAAAGTPRSKAQQPLSPH
jgi:hypothetical protein